MDICVSDWIFRVDTDATYTHTSQNARDHCECGYCRNYYDCVDMIYPEIRSFLVQFGVLLEGPSELLPFEPTLILACYRVQGTVLQWGRTPLFLREIPVMIEIGENDSFLLWIGELRLPWCQDEPEEQVVSPANMPEFMERMQTIWLLRHGEEFIFS